MRQLSDQQASIVQTLAELQETTSTLSQTIIQYVQKSSTPKDPKHQVIVEDIWFSAWPPGPADPQSNQINEASFPDAIIRSLKFQGDTHRAGAIPRAYQKTFEWIFAKPSISDHNKPLWPDFTEWLQSPSQEIYWITGKPGSGKSTLMKHIAEHTNTIAALNRWTMPRPLLLAKFYFWNAGTSLQKSQLGLFRTLLWQCLSRMPSITPRVCPRRWALYKVFGYQAFDATPNWSWAELMESFSLILPLIGDSFNLALFIDGLDEFSGTHEKLIDFINLFRGQQGSKICISSRPWNVFLDAFSCNSSLKMEDLTSKDIQVFVKGRFDQKQGYRELEQIHPQDAQKLVNGIVMKAQGVFLWVSIVVNTLCEGLTEGDKFSDLQAELDRLPSDLEKLYSSIWAGVQGKYTVHSSQLFQILDCAMGLLDAVTLALADDDNALGRDINSMTTETREYIRKNMKRRLNSRTRGLLEVSRDGQVGYLHRSVRDWTVKMWPEILSAAPDFDPHLALLKALTVKIPWMMRGKSIPRVFPEYFWRYVCQCFYHASGVRDDHRQLGFFVKVLDRLDHELSEIHTHQMPPLYRNSTSITPLTEDNRLPHWASTQREWPLPQTYAEITPPHVNFLGLAAQFAVLPYVRHKVLQNPKVLATNWEEITIVECAIFGFKHFCLDEFADFIAHYGDFSACNRLELVGFLLEQGGLQHPQAGPRDSHAQDLQTQIYDRACHKIGVLASGANAESEQAQYWHGIVNRLNNMPAKRTPTLLDIVKTRGCVNQLRSLFKKF